MLWNKVSLESIACIAGGFVGERVRERAAKPQKQRNGFSLPPTHYPHGILHNSRSHVLPNKTASSAGYREQVSKHQPSGHKSNLLLSCFHLINLFIQLINTNMLFYCVQCMSKETGISWNKRFKSQYGPLTKVLILTMRIRVNL